MLPIDDATDEAMDDPIAPVATTPGRAPPTATFAQERLWMIDRLVEDRTLYNTGLRFVLDGPLDPAALRDALQCVVDRHEVLRCGFSPEDGRPLPQPALDVVLREVDLRGHAGADAEAARLQREDLAIPFDLAAPPLFRWCLVRLDDTRHVLSLTVHHIVFDGASIDILLGELATLYPACSAGGMPVPPDMPTAQCSDEAAAERARLDDATRARLQAAWRDRLGDDLPVLSLPTDRPRPPRARQRGGTVVRTRDRAWREALDAACRRERATPFMFLLAAYSAWLCRYAGQDDVVVATPYAARATPASRALIGFFVNTLALRLRGDPGAPFRDWLRVARDSALGGFRQADLPFGDVVQMFGAQRDGSHPPVAQTMLVVQGRHAPVMLGESLRIRYAGEVQADRARFDIALVMDEDDDGVDVRLEYDRDLFDAASASRMLDHFLALLESAIADPGCAVDRLSMLSDRDRRQLQAWSQDRRNSPPTLPAHRLFARLAAEAPDAPAVRHDSERLTRGTLQARADRLAVALRTRGVVTGDLVGICLPRSADFITAVLALWNLGCAYLPMDPEHPDHRLAWLADDARLRHVVTLDTWRGRFETEDRHALAIDDGLLRAALDETTAPALTDHHGDPSARAYVIHTSGSTGEPKGVAVAHAALSRLLGGPADMGYDHDTVMLLGVNPAFDAAILETWGPLCRGGEVVIGPTPSLELPTLRALIVAQGVNTVTLPASLLDMWVDMLDGPTGLTRIVVGGEALSIATIRRLYTLDPQVVAINHYGPTENGILTTHHAIPRAEILQGAVSRMPIGVAVPGTTLHVVDHHGRWQPPGVIGELVVGGSGVAQGYLHRSTLTGERFVALDPTGEGRAPERVYRTGDLVRWQVPDDDGPARLLFAGRVDQQVKVRGFRIEPGEIEAKLRACTGVQDARVLVRDIGGDRRLVGYVIAATDDAARWRTTLQATLPGYMVPAAFVRVDAWPLTRNGKIDVAALPLPGPDTVPNSGIPPRSERERWLHDAWCDLLGVSRIGVEDDFFALGGHSLLATRLHHRILDATGIDLPLRVLFDASDLASMAAAIDAVVEAHPASTASVSNSVSMPVSAIPVRDPGLDAPLSFAQQRLWFAQKLDPDSAQYHIPYRLRLQGALDVDALRSALQDLVARHDGLRTLVVDTTDGPRQRSVAMTELLRKATSADDGLLRSVDLRGIPADRREAEALRRIHEDTARPFDLERDIPLRGLLLRLDDDLHLLALTLHHIAADGASMTLFEREWVARYAAHAGGDAPPLSPMSLRYADYAAWQRDTLDDATLTAKLDTLQARLQGAPAVHDLPLDHPRPPRGGSRGAAHRQRLTVAQVARLQAFARSHDVTLFMLLHSAFTVLVSRFSGSTDLVIGTPVANRQDDTLAPLIGLFLDTVVLRSDLSGDPRFVDLLVRNRRVALDAFDTRDVPLDLVVERVNPTRGAAHTPLFQLLFALQDMPVSTPSLPGLQVTVLEIDDRDAKFDLALNLLQDADGILAEWDYDAALFDPSSITGMASAYAVLLDAILDAPETPILALPLLDAEGRARMLALGNDTDRPYPLDACLHEACELHAARTPDTIALRFEGVSHTYAALNAEANRLARALRALGVGPEVAVAIAMPRHPALVVALLAILKAGGTFVAVDPQAPAQRLRHLLADSGARVLISHGAGDALDEALAALEHPPSVLDPIADTARWRDRPAHDLDRTETGLRAEHGAYLIYTSGSTGQPKGVINTHRGIVNRMCWMQERYPLRPGDRFLQTAAIGFGAAILEIFWPLHAGATVLLARPDGYKDPGYLIDTIVREDARAAHFVPSLLRALLEHPRAAEAGRLADLFCGGELLTATVARRCRERLPGTRLHHLYGSSEAAVLSTQWDVVDGALPERLPIGSPGANTRVYILDARGEPVPRGVRGELYIAGRQVAREYLRQPALSAARFLPDLARPGSGERMYRSGDLGRHRADGGIEYLGRDDFQVKIRGQRVEPGEIEAQLVATEGVVQAVVVARDLGDGDQWLVAYLVPRASDADPQSLSTRNLIDDARRRVDAQLPDYMRPAAYAILPALPLNANGKLDRAALPLPTATHSSERSAPRPAETPMQHELLALWQELLPAAGEIGIDSDFFVLGGHSLLALRLSNRLREQYGHELELKPFFADPTVHALADLLEQRLGAQRALERFQVAEAADIVEF